MPDLPQWTVSDYWYDNDPAALRAQVDLYGAEGALNEWREDAEALGFTLVGTSEDVLAVMEGHAR